MPPRTDPHCTGKTGKMANKLNCQGKLSDFEILQNTWNVVYSSCKFSDYKDKDTLRSTVGQGENRESTDDLKSKFEWRLLVLLYFHGLFEKNRALT